MLLQLGLALAIGGSDPSGGPDDAALLRADGGVCLGTGYCAAPDPGRSGTPPAGLMYLALGLVGAGIGLFISGSAGVSARDDLNRSFPSY